MRPVDWTRPVNFAHPLNRGLVSWWLVGRNPYWGGLTWRDLCNRNHGTLTNGPVWKGATRPGGWGAIGLGGSAKYVATSGSAFEFATSSFTVSFWVNATSGIFILGTYSGFGWGMALGSSGQCSWLFYGAGANLDPYPNYPGGATTPDIRGAWRHVAAVYTRASGGTGLSVAAYVDGAFISSDTRANTSIAGSGPLQIGDYSTQTQSLVGSLDDARIYNRALSAAEVRNLYDESRRGYPESLNRYAASAYRPSSSAIGWHPAVGVF